VKPLDTDVVVVFRCGSEPVPLKVKIEEGVFKIDRIKSIERRKLAGEDEIYYACTSHICERSFEFEIKYTIRTCSWKITKLFL